MRKLVLGMLLMGLAGSALAIERPDLDYRIRLLTAKFEAMQAKPDTAIPAGVLENAVGIVLLDRTKAGFLVAFEGGGGVALVRQGNHGPWSAPAFIGASDVSLGFQVGGEQGFYALVLMNTNALRLLTVPNYEYGSEARGTAGMSSGGAESKDSPLEQSDVLVFSDRTGLFGGADLSAGKIEPDEKANLIYYQQPVGMAGVLFDNKVPKTDSAAALAQELDRASKESTKADR